MGAENEGQEWYKKPIAVGHHPFWAFAYSSLLKDTTDYQVWKPEYEKEMQNATGLRKKAFEHVEAGKNFVLSKYPNWEKQASIMYLNNDFKYENLLKRVDATERNLRSEQRLSKYANKRGVVKGGRSLFNSNGTFGNFGDEEGSAKRRRRDFDTLGLMDGVGI